MDEIIKSILDKIGLPGEDADQLMGRISTLVDKGSLLLENAIDSKSEPEIILAILSETALNTQGLSSFLSFSDKYLRDNFHTLTYFEKGVFWHLNGYLKDKKKDSKYLVLSSLNKSILQLNNSDHSLVTYYLSRVHNTLGQIAHREGLLGEAIQDFEFALKYKKVNNDKYGMALTYGNLGRLYFESGEYENAKEYFLKDLAILKHSFPDLLNIRSQILSNLGQCLIELFHYQEAERYFEESILVANECNDSTSRIYALLGLGKVNVAQGQTSTALEINNKASHDIEPMSTGRDRDTINFYWYQLKGLIAEGVGNLENANQIMDIGCGFIQNASLSNIEISNYLLHCSTIKEKIGLKSESLELLKQALTYLDSTSAGKKRKELELILKEKSKDQWLLHTFSRFIGHEKLEEVLDNTGLEGFSGNNMQLAILFVDIRGFTKIAEHLQNKEIIDLLNDFLERMIHISHIYNGYVDKILGDALLVHFSIPNPSKDDCNHAAMCGLHMLEEVTKMNRLIKSTYPSIEIGIGIHFGEVVAGLIGSASKRSFTVIGDAVNSASRLEGLTKILGSKIIVSGAFIDALQDSGDFNFLYLGRYKVYGREQSMHLYSLKGMITDCLNQKEIDEMNVLSEETFRAFFEKNFIGAKRGFEKLYAKTKLPSYTMLIENCNKFILVEPESTWDGSIQIFTK